MLAPTALLITRDDALLEDMLRLAAAAGVTLDVAHDSSAGVRAWSSAPVVLVGADQVPTLAARQPVRREQVHVVSAQTVPDQLFRAALMIGAQNVVELPAAESWVVDLLTDTADGGARKALTVGVVGGAGGVGATTFAAALAMTATTPDTPGLLMDADPLGGGIDRVVGLEDAEGIRWDSLVQTMGRFSSRSLREALPQKHGLAVLTWSTGPRSVTDAAAVREVLSAAQRGHDTVVIDLPRYLDTVTTDVLARCDDVVLVSGLTVPAVAAASRVAARLEELGRRVHLVTRGHSSALRAEDVSRALGVPLAASMVAQRRLAESVDLGLGPVRSRRSPLARASRAVLDQLTHSAASAA